MRSAKTLKQLIANILPAAKAKSCLASPSSPHTLNPEGNAHQRNFYSAAETSRIGCPPYLSSNRCPQVVLLHTPDAFAVVKHQRGNISSRFITTNRAMWSSPR